jgi:hypothetical protein
LADVVRINKEIDDTEAIIEEKDEDKSEILVKKENEVLQVL